MVQEGTLDFIGVINWVDATQDIKLKNGTSKPKRTIELLDNSSSNGLSIVLTVWGDQSTYFTGEVGNVIAIKGAKLSLYQGK